MKGDSDFFPCLNARIMLISSLKFHIHIGNCKVIRRQNSELEDRKHFFTSNYRSQKNKISSKV